MSSPNYYHMCHRNVGRAVCIRTHDGREYRGFIDRVTPNRVFLRPMGNRRRDFGGYGYGWGWGFGTGIAIGLIASLAFIPFFW